MTMSMEVEGGAAACAPRGCGQPSETIPRTNSIANTESEAARLCLMLEASQREVAEKGGGIRPTPEQNTQVSALVALDRHGHFLFPLFNQVLSIQTRPE